MCGGDGDGVGTFVDELADVGNDAIFIERAVSLAVRRNGSATHEAEVAVAGGLDQLMRFFADALDIAQSEEASEAIVVIDDEQFVNAEVLGEKIVGGLDRVLAHFLLGQRVDLLARRHGFGD